jgi:hypothetical protein
LPDDVLRYFSVHCESEEDGTSKAIELDGFEKDLVYVIDNGKFYVEHGKKEALLAKLTDPWLISLGTRSVISVSNIIRPLLWYYSFVARMQEVIL